jgi:DNA-binding transcriptional LysR family regulator
MIDSLEGKWFKTFIIVYEQKSFSKAAELLGYVQSTITTHIQLLERACGQKLFDRLPRGVEATEAGIQLSSYAYQFLQLGEAMGAAMRMQSIPSGTVKLQVLESFCVSYLPAFFTRFFDAYPQVRLELSTGFYKDTLKAVLDRRVHVGIVPQDPARDDIVFHPLIREELVFIAAPVLSLKMDDVGNRGDVKVISFGGRCIYRTIAHETLQQQWGLDQYESLEYASLEMIKQTVIQGIGIALVPKIAVEQELLLGKLVYLQLKERIHVTHGVIALKGMHLNAAVKALKETIQNLFRENETVSTGSST